MKLVNKLDDTAVSDIVYFIARSGLIGDKVTIRLTEQGTGRVLEYPSQASVFGFNTNRIVVPVTDMIPGEYYKAEFLDNFDNIRCIWKGVLYCTDVAGFSLDNKGKYPHTINKDQYSVDKNDDNREYIILED